STWFRFSSHRDILGLRQFCSFQQNGALDPFFLQSTALRVGAHDGSGGMIGIGSTAAAAIELGPAVFAIFFAIQVTVLKLLALGLISYSIPNIAHQKFGHTGKLMAGIQV